MLRGRNGGGGKGNDGGQAQLGRAAPLLHPTEGWLPSPLGDRFQPRLTVCHCGCMGSAALKQGKQVVAAAAG